jgi:hypothetical protein
MSVSEGPVVSRSLVSRIKGILTQPSAEWRVIDTEPATVGGLYASYIAPLSAIGPIASTFEISLIGRSLPFGGHFQIPFRRAVESAVLGYVFGLIGVYVLALVVDALAPTFGGQKSMIQALKVVAYSGTAACVGAIVGVIFWIIPGLNILVPGILAAFLGVYGVYLLYLGLPILMKSPADKALAYTVTIVCAMVIFSAVYLVAVRMIVYPHGMQADQGIARAMTNSPGSCVAAACRGYGVTLAALGAASPPP